jgi:PIN domain nuclease of toxin-antitoxin system
LEFSETLQTLITMQQLAQSIKEQMLIISADQAFTGYPVSLIW